MSMASWTSPRVSARTLPISCVMARANSSLRRTRISAARNNISARFGAGTRRQDLYAARADSTAVRTSCSSDAGKIPRSSDVSAGLRFSKVREECVSVHWPPIKFLKVLEATALAMLLSGVVAARALDGGRRRRGGRSRDGSWRAFAGDVGAEAQALESEGVNFSGGREILGGLELLHRF